MAALIKYEAACRSLAEAHSVDEVKDIRDKAEAMRVYAIQSKNVDLEVMSYDIRMRGERRLGELIIEAKAQGTISRGQPKKNCADEEQYSRIKLDELGIDRKMSARAQKLGGLAEQAFEAMVAARREQIRSNRATPINGARSIMGSRQEPDDSLDYFPTPPWATRALVEKVLRPHLGTEPLRTAWEPACGEGHIAEVLQEYFSAVSQSDLFDYGYGNVNDFLADQEGYYTVPVDWIITNPPFGDKTEHFVLRSIERSKVGVAMFVRLQWLESVGRYENIFRDNPPTLIAFFAERVNLCKARWDPEGTTATAYIWLVWIRGTMPRAPIWIPPGQREALTRPDDAIRFTTHPVTKAKRDASGNILSHDGDGVVDDDAETPAAQGEAA